MRVSRIPFGMGEPMTLKSGGSLFAHSEMRESGCLGCSLVYEATCSLAYGTQQPFAGYVDVA